jgi:cell division topological specificity factor
MFIKLLALLGLQPINTHSAAPNNSSPFDIDNSGRAAACNRLRLVLMHDRTQLEPHVLESMRDDLVALISKYVEVDRHSIELNLETDPDTNQVALMANIPVKKAKDSLIVSGTTRTLEPTV